MKRNQLDHQKYSLIRGKQLLCFLLVVISLLSSCGKAKNRALLAQRLAETEAPPSPGAAAENQRVAELKLRIRGVEKRAEETIKAVQDKGTFWRLLGLKYMDLKMWGKALEAFEEASLIYPRYAAVLYYRGLSAAQVALSSPDSQTKEELLAQAENSYRQAIEADNRYSNPYYALAVLLVFELDRSREAGRLLDQFLAIEKSDVSGRFLRARVYLEEGRSESALRLYEEIQKTAPLEKDRDRAAWLHREVRTGGSGA